MGQVRALLLMVCLITRVVAYAQTSENISVKPSNEIRTGVLHRVFGGALGDHWSTYISASGLAPIKPIGSAKLDPDGISGSNETTDMKSLVSGKFQLGTYVSAFNNPYHFRMGLGYDYVEISSDFGDSKLHSVAIEFMPFYQISSHRIGAGVEFVVFSELEAQDMDATTYKTKSSMGYAAEYGYNLKSISSWVSLRYQRAEYSIAKNKNLFQSDRLINESVGLGLSYQFN